MERKITYTSQSRLNFDLNRLLQMGIDRAYVTPFTSNNEALSEPDVILANLELLAAKAKTASQRGLKIYPFFETINHPEGNFQLPQRYRMQSNMDGSPRPEYICFRDKVRQAEMIQFASKAAELGFERIAFDDDLRDAFCYCDEHINGYAPFTEMSREDIAEILNGILTHPQEEDVRKNWYQYKYDGMLDYARRLEKAIHIINPGCRIGIFNSAKRCQDFSGRDPVEWINLFSTPDAPAFVRLCGECYDDEITHLVQSTGWHQYFDRSYPSGIERMLEITSVPAIGYRSAGNVLLETKAVVAATTQDTVHWAWTEEFDNTSLGDYIGPAKEELSLILNEIKESPSSPLALYIGPQLGSFMPINISTTYGATHDPIAAYNIMNLVGLPVTVVPTIPDNQPSVLCSGYISRDMTIRIDMYVKSGGVAIIDAKAAQCYKAYGGMVDFTISGPVSLHRYEIGPSGERDEMISECMPDSIFQIISKKAGHCWTGYDISNAMTGLTTAILSHGKGKLIILGYDLSRTNTVLLRPQWQKRMLDMLGKAGVQFPVYWKGPAAVQCFYYTDQVILLNYNSNTVRGKLAISGKEDIDVSINALELKFIRLNENHHEA